MTSRDDCHKVLPKIKFVGMVDVTQVKNPVSENGPFFVKQFVKLVKLNYTPKHRVALSEVTPKHL